METREHKTFFGKIFGTAWDSIKSWFGDIFKEADHDLLTAAILVTNVVKNTLSSGLVQFAVTATPTKLDDQLLAAVNKKLPQILAGELFLQGITPTSTQEEVQAVLQKVLDAFGGLPEERKAKFYTEVAAEIYIFVEETKNGKKVTFGRAAALAEGAYQAWLKEQSSNS